MAPVYKEQDQHALTNQSDDERVFSRHQKVDQTYKSSNALNKPKSKPIEKTHKTREEHVGKRSFYDQENDSRLSNGANRDNQSAQQPPMNNFYNNNYTINYNNYENIT